MSVLSQSDFNPRLSRFLPWAILLLTAGYTFLDYWEYSRIQHTDPRPWAQLATGQGLAPAQYRIGVYYTANFLAHLSHLQFRHIFAAADFGCTALALFSLFYLLTGLDWFRKSAHSAQWAQVFLALLLTQLYLVWTLWFQQPETMPSFAVLAAAAFLCCAITQETPPVPRLMLAVSLLMLAALGATIRADIVTALASGIVLASVDSRGKTPARSWLLTSGLIALLAALAVEFFITHQLFPHAVRSAPPFQLLGNLKSVNGTLAILCTLPPWGLTVWLASRNWSRLPLWIKALVIGSALHFVMYLTFGMSEEVRIFLPFTLVLMPLSATLLYHWLSGEAVSPA
jgi:hypothetical protein